jgi:hypothetical protein
MFTESQSSVDDVLTARLKNRPSQPTTALKSSIHLAWGGTTGQVAEKLHRIAAFGWRSGFGVAQWLWGRAAALGWRSGFRAAQWLSGGAAAFGRRSGFRVAQRLWGGAALQALR